MTAPRFARWLTRLAAPAKHVHRRCIGSGSHRRDRAAGLSQVTRSTKSLARRGGGETLHGLGPEVELWGKEQC